jgi:hypothetical protein
MSRCALAAQPECRTGSGFVGIEKHRSETEKMTQTQKIASIIVTGALEEMSRISGAAVVEILSVMLSDPNGNTARRFRDYVKLGAENTDRIVAAATVD